jgi:predicted RNA-binding Zn-ribbon protein involved in translation (DUF1610 family)
VKKARSNYLYNWRAVIVKCPNCGTEMENNYVLRLGLSGAIKIEKERNIELQSSLPKISVCPNCGKVDIYVDVESV